jgi:glycosyltransferase involved in cell wall biosynthesis
MTSPVKLSPPEARLDVGAPGASTGDDALRVVQVLDSFEEGGAQRVALQLSSWLVDQGAEVAIFGKDGPLAVEVARGIPHPHVNAGGFIRETLQLAEFCRSYRPHLLHAHQRREALMCLLVGRALGIPYVEHAHTYLPDRRFGALSFRGSRIFAVSEEVRGMVVDEFGRSAERVALVGNTASNVSDTPAIAWQQRHDRPLRIVGIGRLVDQKDPFRFVGVVAELARRTPVEAVWLGDGLLIESARRLAATLAAPITFPGRSANVTAAIDHSDLLVMTSRWEGTPLAILETFARHRSVIATHASGGDGVLGEGRAVVVPDDASDEQFADAVIAGMGDEDAVRARIAAADDYTTLVASPERVFGAVLRDYRSLVLDRTVGLGSTRSS